MIAFGIGDSRAVEVRLLHGRDHELRSHQVDDQLVKGAFAPLAQALPQLLLDHQVSTTHLMEVVVRGDLVRAADGGGWRAFAIGPDGIQQHARLHDVEGLQALAGGLLGWQLASMLVGQKVLYDIRRRLEQIEHKLDKVIGMLKDDRRAVVEAGLRYVLEVVDAAENGELIDAARPQLEQVDHELATAFVKCRREIERLSKQPLVRGKFGSSSHLKGVQEQLYAYQTAFQDLSACVMAREACFYATSLFPGGRVMLARRQEALRADSRLFEQMGKEVRKDVSQRVRVTKPTVSRKVRRFIGNLHPLLKLHPFVLTAVGAAKIADEQAAWLARRKIEIRHSLRALTRCLKDGVASQVGLDDRISGALLARDAKRTLYVTVDGGQVVEVRELNEC